MGNIDLIGSLNLWANPPIVQGPGGFASGATTVSKWYDVYQYDFVSLTCSLFNASATVYVDMSDDQSTYTSESAAVTAGSPGYVVANVSGSKYVRARVVTGGNLTAGSVAIQAFTALTSPAGVVGPITDMGGQVFNVKAYGAKVDGVTDDTASVNNAIAAAMINGGSVFIPPGVGGALCLCLGAIEIPYTGTALPTQRPIRIFGTVPTWNGYWMTAPPPSGSGLDLRFAGDGGIHVAKIDTRGSGYLEIDHLILKSGGSDNFPFIQTTNTTIFGHNNFFWGNDANSGTTCLQNAWILGGAGGAASLTTALVSGTAYTTLDVTALTIAISSGENVVLVSGSNTQTYVASADAAVGATTISVNSLAANFAYPVGTGINTASATQTDAPNAMFQGYGSKLQNNFYHLIQFAHVYGAQCNGITISNETISKSCGSAAPEGAPFTVMNPVGPGGGGAGIIIRGGTVEVTNYKYAVALFSSTGCFVDALGIYDDNGYTVAPI